MHKTGQFSLAKSGLFKTALAALLLLQLSGCAKFLAQSTGTAPLGTNPGVRTLSQVLNDNSIERTSKINMYKLDARFQYARVNINSFHSAVLLTGQVKDPYLKQLAEDNIKAMSDVRAVHNYLIVGEKIPYNTIVQDGIVTANIRRMLLASPLISESKVKVQTEDGVVYVMGKLTPDENRALIDILQKTPNIVKVVSLIDILSDNGVATSNNGLTQASITNPLSITSGNLSSTSSAITATTPSSRSETPVAVDPEKAAPDQPVTAKIP